MLIMYPSTCTEVIKITNESRGKAIAVVIIATLFSQIF
jgi:hypothetical protein